LNSWKNYFFQLLYEYRIIMSSRQKFCTYSWAVSIWSYSIWGWNCYCKVKKYKSPSTARIPAELIQAGGELLHFEIYKLINSVLGKKELRNQWKEYVIVPVHKKGDKTYCSNYHGISLLSASYKYLSSVLLSKVCPSYRLNHWELSEWVST
jgi:hypothetical protein